MNLGMHLIKLLFYVSDFDVMSKLSTKRNSLTEAVVSRCSLKKVFLKISQYSQENTCVGYYF